jgi:CHAT domain-containing protein/Tfp pilus assembly protein PilF
MGDGVTLDSLGSFATGLVGLHGGSEDRRPRLARKRTHRYATLSPATEPKLRHWSEGNRAVQFLLLLAWLLASCAAGHFSSGPAAAQSSFNLDNMNRRIAELEQASKYSEAIPLAEQYVQAVSVQHGSDSTEAAVALNQLARLLQASGRFAEAEPLFRRALSIAEVRVGPEHRGVAALLNNLAFLLKQTNQLGEAELLYRRALAIDEKTLGSAHPGLATTLNNLGQLLQARNRLTEAERLMRRALFVSENALGPGHPTVAIRLNNLALLLQVTSRPTEADLLMRRALAIDEKSLGPEHPTVIVDLNNLAVLLQSANRLAEAEQLLRRALSMSEKSLGPEHPSVAVSLNNLGTLLQSNDRMADAEPLLRRALAIDQKNFGSAHPDVVRDLNNLGSLLQASHRLPEAESMMSRALAISEKALGPEHPSVAINLNNLALLKAERGDWTDAVRLHRRALPIMTAARDRQVGGERTALAHTALRANASILRAAARAVYRADTGSSRAREEGFVLAQWALQTGAGDALAQMSVRFTKGVGPLAQLIRRRQDIVARRAEEDRRLLTAVGASDVSGAEASRTAVSRLDDQVAAIDKELAVQFPDYAALANPLPLSLAATQSLLKPDEALVLLLDVPQLVKLPEESLVWVVTRTDARWRSIPLGTRALSDRVSALRCGLDTSSWDGAVDWPAATEPDKQRIAEQQSRRERCMRLLGGDVSPADLPPFDLAKAYELYQALLAPFASVIGAKQLIIVPSGPLTSLPFHVLITKRPAPAFTGMARYQQAVWLARQHAVTVLPSVSSLQALRKLGPSQAKQPYIAFGNPLLGGAGGSDDRAWNRQTCRQSAQVRVTEARAAARRGTALRAIDLAALRAQEPLPETADELCAVAEALGILDDEAKTVWLGERATKRNLTTLSREHKLLDYRIVHFATHGLLAGESEAILKTKAEPALILTPPKEGASAAELEEDDGLLAASDVARLELDADWVILSACNTAAGDKGDAEALSGLARAFFYAKARALLVSHWYVNSDAAVRLTTTAFAELKADPAIGRAEALRRSMLALIEKGGGYAHPANWAPFVVVGEGAHQS